MRERERKTDRETERERQTERERETYLLHGFRRPRRDTWPVPASAVSGPPRTNSL